MYRQLAILIGFVAIAGFVLPACSTSKGSNDAGSADSIEGPQNLVCEEGCHFAVRGPTGTMQITKGVPTHFDISIYCGPAGEDCSDPPGDDPRVNLTFADGINVQSVRTESIGHLECDQQEDEYLSCYGNSFSERSSRIIVEVVADNVIASAPVAIQCENMTPGHFGAIKGCENWDFSVVAS